MSDKLISGRDDISGREVLASRDIRPPETWKPMKDLPSVDEWVPPAKRGLGMFQASSPMRQRMPAMPSGSKPESIEFAEQWPGVHCTDLGAVFDPEKVTVEVWKDFMRDMGGLNRRTRLYLADAIWYNDAAGFGFTLDDMSALTGLEIETLRSYQTIGFQVPIANRILGPKPSIYATVAPLSQARQLEVMKKAKAEGMTRDDIRKLVAPEKKAIREAQIAAGIRPAGRPPKVIPLPASFTDDMEKAAGLIVPHNIETDRFATPLEYEGSIIGARAYLASLPDNARVKIVVTHID